MEVLYVLQIILHVTKNEALNRWSANVADPWLIACAKANDYVLVTFEQSAGKLNPKAPGSNPKIPDIAKEFGVETINLYQMLTEFGVVIQPVLLYVNYFRNSEMSGDMGIKKD